MISNVLMISIHVFHIQSILFFHKCITSTGEDKRNYVNLVIVGHVDSGKSTLIGKLLHLLKVVNEREARKNA